MMGNTNTIKAGTARPVRFALWKKSDPVKKIVFKVYSLLPVNSLSL
jgi:hypothetical protein